MLCTRSVLCKSRRWTSLAHKFAPHPKEGFTGRRVGTRTHWRQDLPAAATPQDQSCIPGRRQFAGYHVLLNSCKAGQNSDHSMSTGSRGKGQEHDAPQSAYIHLPFCKRRCYYCDFPIQAVGPDPTQPRVQDAMQQYVDILCREIKATDPYGTEGLKTIFFGGGTPSLMPPHLLAQILDCVHSSFR